MTEKILLTKTEYLVGSLNEDLQELSEMILRNYNEKRFMATDTDDIRWEDVRIDFTPQVQRIVRTLCEKWNDAFDQEIESCWQNKPGQDPNCAFWAVVHNPGDTTNIHSHETAANYVDGAHVSAALWVVVPPNSGDFVFQYQVNPYLNRQRTICAEAGKFIMFDSTLKHYVTKNMSAEKRIVLSMNFRIKQED